MASQTLPPPSPDESGLPSLPGDQALRYPFAEPPHFGEVLEVAPGVRWVRMPLGGSLGAINCWAIEDGDGWAIVDTGLGLDQTLGLWRKVIEGALEGRPLKRVFVTHMHPDHIGAAGWLTRTFGCELWITRLEYLTCRSFITGVGHAASPEASRFYRLAGWSEEELTAYPPHFGGMGAIVQPLPESFHRVTDGDEIQIGAHMWRVITGAGHSPEHACLHCPDLGVFISGDQVLPKISSNVSVTLMEPEANPLADWLTSLASIRARLPEDVLVLPAHNSPFVGVRQRIDALIEHHETALERLLVMLQSPRRAVDVFPVLFKRQIDGPLLRMATGESLAHLTCLVRRGLASRSGDGEAHWYSGARAD